MDVNTNTVIKQNILILEDEPEIRMDIEYKMKHELEKISSLPLLSENGEESYFRVNHNIISTDNIMQTEEIVYSGKCDLLIADFKVKETSNSRKAAESCLPLLREFKSKEMLLPVIGHTAHPDLRDDALQANLTVETISKEEADSVIKVVNSGANTSQLLNTYKIEMITALHLLDYAANTDSPIEMQQFIQHIQKRFSNLALPSWAPKDYKRTLFTIVPVVLRLTSIPSDFFKLNKLSPNFVKIIKPLITKLCQPIFSFKKDAIPVFKKMEAAGYDVFMRVDDEDS